MKTYKPPLALRIFHRAAIRKNLIFRPALRSFMGLLLCLPSFLWAAPPVILEEGKDKYPLGLHLEILEDKESIFTIEEVASAKFSKRFVPSEVEVPNFGRSPATFWIRFQLRSDLGKSSLWLLEIADDNNAINEIELYLPGAGTPTRAIRSTAGGFIVKKAGVSVPFSQRELAYRNPVFYLSVPWGGQRQNQTFYLRVRNEIPTSDIRLPVRLWSPPLFVESNFKKQHLLGLYYGILVVMVLYNLFIFVTIKDRSYLYYVLYVASFGVMMLVKDQLIHEYWDLEMSSWSLQKINIIVPSLMLFWLVQFSQHFLHTSEYLPRLNKLLWGFRGIWLLFIPLTFLAPLALVAEFNKINKIVSLFNFVILLLSGGLCWRQGFRPARYYLLASFFFMSGVSLHLLKILGILPVTFLTSYGFKIGASLEMILFSFALGDRINLMKEEKEQAQEEHSRTLEHKVEGRTQELQTKNTELQTTLETLKRTQTQLVESEKMASLGGLVAGVAHEINTPLGIGVTAASNLEQEVKDFVKEFQQGQIKKSQFDEFTDIVQQSSHILLTNVQRAAELVQSFKKVAVDLSSETKQSFKIKEYLEEVLRSLHPTLKKTQHTIEIQCDENLSIDSFPGEFSQIVTNLVMNSLTHAYEKEDPGALTEGKMLFDISKDEDKIFMKYSDDGKGIPKENLSKIFDPFYTTKRGKGGTGLGLHIVYNIVTQKLKGSIHCESELKKGTKFIIAFPID